MPDGNDRPYGGRRRGSGRKALASDERTVVYTIRLPESLAQALREIGAEAVRKHLEKVVDTKK